MKLPGQAEQSGPRGSRSMVQVSYSVVSRALSRGFSASLAGGFPLPEVVLEWHLEVAPVPFPKIRAAEA
jgi:hypothetical protein